MHPEAGGVRPFFTGVEYCPYAPSSRLAMAGRGMSTTPQNGQLFLRGPLVLIFTITVAFGWRFIPPGS